jgi:hypothetical protein
MLFTKLKQMNLFQLLAFSQTIQSLQQLVILHQDRSREVLDVSTGDSSSTFVLQAIDISQDPDNSDQSTSNVNVLVRINAHQYKGGVVGLTV